MKRVVAFLSLSISVGLAGCTDHPRQTGTQLFLAGQPSGQTTQLSEKRDHAKSPVFGWTIAAKGAVPKQNYIQVFAVTSGPMAGLVGTEPDFAGAPAHSIGYIALQPFAHSVKVVVVSAQRPGQLADGSHSGKQAEAFGYAIASPSGAKPSAS